MMEVKRDRGNLERLHDERREERKFPTINDTMLSVRRIWYSTNLP